jgi:hypothetical protein
MPKTLKSSQEMYVLQENATVKLHQIAENIDKAINSENQKEVIDSVCLGYDDSEELKILGFDSDFDNGSEDAIDFALVAKVYKFTHPNNKYNSFLVGKSTKKLYEISQTLLNALELN